MPAAVEEKPERPEFPGVVTSRSSRVITADFEGRILNLAVTSRKRVKAGELIAKLDPSTLENELLSLIDQEKGARLDAGAAGASCGQARREMKAQGRLYDRGFAASNTFKGARDQASNSCATAGAAKSKANSFIPRIKQIKEQIALAQLVSPIDGVVTVVKAKEGEVAQKGTPIARGYDDSDLVIRFAVDRQYRSLVTEGQRVELTLEGVDQPVWATIEKIADEEAPINFATVVADIDDRNLRPDEIRVASEGRVRIADAQGARR